MKDEKFAIGDVTEDVLRCLGRETPESAIQKIQGPIKWGDRQPCSDWRNYIPFELEQLWDRLPLEAKAVAYVMARDRVRSEY